VVPKHPRADGGGIPLASKYALRTVTEVTELSFPPPGAAAVWCPAVPEPTGAVYPAPEIRPLYCH
jgi:hypothetical protein